MSKYSAFISYNQKDRGAATALHRQIERWRIPKALKAEPRSSVMRGDRLLPVFRDRDELAAGSDLTQAVLAALAESECLIVVCSPNAARSKWVNEEIRAFRALGRGDRIFCYLIDGEPFVDDSEIAAFPPALLEEGAAEPLAADSRPEQDGKRNAVLKIIAGLTGVGYDDLRQREYSRRVKRLTLAAGVATLAFVVTAGLAVLAYIARNEAIVQRELADERALTAERTVSFVKDMFETADPSQALGETITAREVVDRGATMLAEGLDEEPTVRAELGITLSEVYAALGLLRRSDELAVAAAAIDVPRTDTRIRQLIAVADSRFRLSQYDEALAYFEQAEALLTEDTPPDLKSRLHFAIGQTHSWMDQFELADRSLRQALRIDRSRGPGARIEVARDLEAVGTNLYYAAIAGQTDFAQVEPPLNEASEIRLAEEGPMSPGLADARNLLAGIAMQERRFSQAEQLYRQNLDVDEQVLGAEHPDTAITLNNLARSLLEQGEYREAEPLLERAMAISLNERGEMHDENAFVFANLAIARRQTGNIEDAMTLFSRAIAVAREYEHPILAPSLVNLAELECRGANVSTGLSLLSEAPQLMARDYPGDAWRLAWIESVEGLCLWYAGQKPAGRAQLEQATRQITQEWDANTMVGQLARRRLRLTS